MWANFITESGCVEVKDWRRATTRAREKKGHMAQKREKTGAGAHVTSGPLVCVCGVFFTAFFTVSFFGNFFCGLCS
jgi:hypothetical protein